jgi:Rv0078B-related antitoxin
MTQENKQHEIIKKMSPQQKLEASMSLYHSAKKLKAAWLKQQHPDWTSEQIDQAVRKAFAHART